MKAPRGGSVCVCVCLSKPVLPYCSFCTRHREQQSVILINTAVAGRRTDPPVRPGESQQPLQVTLWLCPHIFADCFTFEGVIERCDPEPTSQAPFMPHTEDVTSLSSLTSLWLIEAAEWRWGQRLAASIFNSSGSFLVDGRWDVLHESNLLYFEPAEPGTFKF